MLATGTTGSTTFALSRLIAINYSTNTLNYMNIGFLAELWRMWASLLLTRHVLGYTVDTQTNSFVLTAQSIGRFDGDRSFAIGFPSS